MYSYRTRGICAQQIDFSIEDGLVKGVSFYGGCSGNLQAISKLVEGMEVEEAIEKLRGIDCGGKMTSCSDQLSLALEDSITKQVG
ncbi:MAG: TIGR03905 family TSCPD domain-containing protein [Clostridiaceae bacterium]|nr:TIGR03905 family TSCPD domain-containing protein [Clostridiaceae bacterium]